MGIKVIAIRQGYYGHFREINDEFTIKDEEAFSDSWMERLDGKPRAKLTLKAPETTGNNPAGALPPNPDNDLV